MPRKKITEFKAKSILFDSLNLPYKGLHINTAYKNQIQKLKDNKDYVVKVDQGVKKRFKNGLIKVGIKKNEISKFVDSLIKRDYSNFIIEELVPHEQSQEKYIAFERVREGIKMYFSNAGGVDIEENSDTIEIVIFKNSEDKLIDKYNKLIGVEENFLKNIILIFEKYHFTFFEINPLVVIDNKWYILDLAAEVDSVGEYFVNGVWSTEDFVDDFDKNTRIPEVKNIEELKEKSTASFKLNVINENGSLFMLLSGGGASVVLADEAYQRGFKDEIANYGEYSGSPNTEETYIYAKNIITLLLRSKAKKKALIIAGGVANFTDVYVTFKGIIQALDEFKEPLQKQKVKVYVRRGGPNQALGLSTIKEFLEKNRLYGQVSGPELVLTDIINEAINYIK